MPPIIPKPFQPVGTGKSGFTISVVDAKKGQHIRIGISQAAQSSHFGGPFDHEVHALKLALSNDQGKNHILTLELAKIGDPNAFTLSPGIKGSVSIKLQPWGPLAKGKRPATEMVVIGGRAPSIVNLKLPEYARPEVKKIGQGEPLMG
ncbi:hypothetical protein MACH17_18140 [Phaeobacter inhibens]|uniref:hypothetical protein n=1 Tax=Phaeobacter inhibens TaxID=221822 RepID=UPI00275FB0B5|nr:hypothetical protein [Phaeobacter inhibens]GLO70297.1 hypothetical protein MACH17_18140 [Phaeobacter inhibens]